MVDLTESIGFPRRASTKSLVSQLENLFAHIHKQGFSIGSSASSVLSFSKKKNDASSVQNYLENSSIEYISFFLIQH